MLAEVSFHNLLVHLDELEVGVTLTVYCICKFVITAAIELHKFIFHLIVLNNFVNVVRYRI